MINDDLTSNPPGIYVKLGETYWGIGRVRGREKQREQIRGEREAAFVKMGNGAG